MMGPDPMMQLGMDMGMDPMMMMTHPMAMMSMGMDMMMNDPATCKWHGLWRP